MYARKSGLDEADHNARPASAQEPYLDDDDLTVNSTRQSLQNEAINSDMEESEPGPGENRENIDPENEPTVTGQNLGEDLLEILGNEPVQTAIQGPPVHDAIKVRWSEILKNGISEDIKLVMLNKHLVPENLPGLLIPKLNPEVTAALSSQVLKRDERLVQKQQQLVTSISAIGKAISLMIEKQRGDDREYIELLSNAGRLLCDFHHNETKIRRDLISINLNKDLRDTLTDAPIDQYLFGASLDERLKTAKILEKSSIELKPGSISNNEGSTGWTATRESPLSTTLSASAHHPTIQTEGAPGEPFEEAGRNSGRDVQEKDGEIPATTLAANEEPDFQWWLDNIGNAKNDIRADIYHLEIFSDASKTGWGAYCDGRKGWVFWTETEANYHINVLELKAAFFALRVDNTTALAYINKMGSVQYPVLNNVARSIWQWCESKNIFIYASYIKSKDNYEADAESRVKLSKETEWEINNSAFRDIRNTSSTVADDFPGSRNFILQALISGGVPDDALEICLASITNSTIQQYNTGLKLWWQFRKAKNLSLFSASVEEVLEFFTMMFKKGASFASLSFYRAALAQILNPSLTSDFRIRRFFKGAHSIRPTPAKYSHTWDPGIVLSYIKTMPEPLNLENLGYKLAILIALATGQRVQTLANIEVRNIISYDDRIEIKIPNRLKTSGRGIIQPTLILPYYNLDKNICPARAVLSYLEKTKILEE
ncbi:hypothetical protein NQ317_018814 [Molorchus minor]|uniref:Uncharacterized protein n=1 Tax=Molorchus minor TaxID=1323400 RepID=A0ABQ9JSR7_9CUCU|nr:hypothetical protein NQ317_018814 [Molorchus minor]